MVLDACGHILVTFIGGDKFSFHLPPCRAFHTHLKLIHVIQFVQSFLPYHEVLWQELLVMDKNSGG